MQPGPAAGAAPDQAQALAPDQAAGLARLLAALPWAHLARLHGLADGGDLRGARAGVRWLPGDPGDPALRAACQQLMRRLLCQARPCALQISYIKQPERGHVLGLLGCGYTLHRHPVKRMQSSALAHQFSLSI